MTTVTLLDVIRNINQSNNGYVFASNLDSEYLRQTERLVSRAVIKKVTFTNDTVAFFTKEAYAIFIFDINKKTSNFPVTIDYETRCIAKTEQYLSEC